MAYHNPTHMCVGLWYCVLVRALECALCCVKLHWAALGCVKLQQVALSYNKLHWAALGYVKL